jgi:hypothetical protein
LGRGKGDERRMEGRGREVYLGEWNEAWGRNGLSSR